MSFRKKYNQEMYDRDNYLTMLIETSIDLKQKVLRID